jgi:hypothetical protein
VSASSSFEITYAAHTATCTFLLDGEGICRRIVVIESSRRGAPSSKTRDAKLAARCVGAQYVASLDPTISGMLAEMPRVGASMLFARVDDRGRVSLVRTGVVTRFESHRADEDPFSTDKSPSMSSVETSAPVITPSQPTPRFPRQKMKSSPGATPPDVYEENSGDRTQPLTSLRPGEFLRMHASAHHTDSVEVPAVAIDIPIEEEDASSLEETLARTSEYKSEGAARRTWPSPGNEEAPSSSSSLQPPLQTLRQPHAFALSGSEDREDPYAAPPPPAPPPGNSRIPLPRASSPRPRADRIARTPTGTVAATTSSDKIALRRNR